MENATQIKKIQFHGNGGELFKVGIINFLLTVITLGVYYPWAKAALLRYYYQETEFDGNRFQFHGTGKELFIGMLKSLGVFLVILLVAGAIGAMVHPALGIVVAYLTLIGLIPFAVVESLNYRFSRTSLNGVHFNYQGTASKMASVYFPGVLLTLVTFGFYSVWLMVALQKEITGNTRFGNVSFEYTGSGSELFGKVIIGYLLMIVTLGIYVFWLAADLHNYSYNHTFIIQNNEKSRFHATVTGSGLFGMAIIDALLLVFTLGLAFPWVIIRNHRYIAQNLFVEGSFNLAVVPKTSQPYATATGEGLAEGLELSLG